MKLRLSILTAGDFPFGMAMESFVRQLSLGLFYNSVELEVIRLHGDRFNNVNDTGIKCSNYLFTRPVNSEIFKIIVTIFQVLFVPIFVFQRRLMKGDRALILYGIDRAYFVFPLIVFGKLFGLKLFRINTELYPADTYAYNWWRKPLILFNNIQIQYFDKLLNGIVVLSHFLQNLERTYGVPAQNILLIPHFINVDANEKDLESFKDLDTKRIGYCGYPSIQNGIIDLIDAFEILQKKGHESIELVIIGDLPAVVEQEIVHRSLKNVVYTGKLTAEEVLKELRKCFILVNPRRLGVSADSGFPTKIGEYFASNRTVVSTKVGDLSLYFKDKEELIFVEANCPASIAEGIAYGLLNRDAALEIAKRGNQWAFEHLDYKKNSKRVADFIAERA